MPPKVCSYVPAQGLTDSAVLTPATPAPPVAHALSARGKAGSATPRARADVVDMRVFLEQPVECDLLDQHVQWLLSQSPDLARRHSVRRKRPGVYEVDRHEVWIEWQPARGVPMVIDGPLRQPLADYLQMTEKNAHYDTHLIAKMTSLHKVPKDQRVTFDDKHERYHRLKAMKVATEQARIREQAASCTNKGQETRDLLQKYNRKMVAVRSPRRRGEGSSDDECDENSDPAPNLEKMQGAWFATAKAIRAPTSSSQVLQQHAATRSWCPASKAQTPVGMAAAGSRPPSVGAKPPSLSPRPASVEASRLFPEDFAGSVPAAPARRLPLWAVGAPRGYSLNGLPLMGAATPPSWPAAAALSPDLQQPVSSGLPATVSALPAVAFPLPSAAGSPAAQSFAKALVSARGVTPSRSRASPSQTMPAMRAASPGPKVASAGHLVTPRDIHRSTSRGPAPLAMATAPSSCTSTTFGVPRTWSGTSLAGSVSASLADPELAEIHPVVTAIAVPTPRCVQLAGQHDAS